jgi:hypothetical protein
MHQIFTFQRFFSVPIRAINFAEKSILIFTLVLFGTSGSSLLQAQNAPSDSFFKEKEIRFSKASIELLFEMKNGTKSKLVPSSDKVAKPTVEITILNNMEPGKNSGALSAVISIGKADARLLMNRKVRNGKLEYWIVILLNEGTDGFKLTQESNGEFILTRTPKSQIVSE